VIEAVFFDYDGVLTRDKTGSLTTNRFISEHTGIPYDDVARALARHNRELNLGLVEYAQIWPTVCADLGRQIAPDLLVRAFESSPVNEAMMRLARGYRGRFIVGIITDNKKERIDHLKRFQRLADVFSPIAVSSEVRCNKEDPGLFRWALDRAGVDAARSVFIDNTPDNLVTAAAVGMNVVHFDDSRNDVADLARRLDREFAMSR
jgi:putative hydrolase of the HAD superfamily